VVPRGNIPPVCPNNFETSVSEVGERCERLSSLQTVSRIQTGFEFMLFPWWSKGGTKYPSVPRRIGKLNNPTSVELVLSHDEDTPHRVSFSIVRGSSFAFQAAEMGVFSFASPCGQHHQSQDRSCQVSTQFFTSNLRPPVRVQVSPCLFASKLMLLVRVHVGLINWINNPVRKGVIYNKDKVAYKHVN
jgi:hypothetical protein